MLGPESQVYHSLQTATPPDLPMSWSMEEISELQDRTAIECVLKMRGTLDKLAEDVYTCMMSAS